MPYTLTSNFFSNQVKLNSAIFSFLRFFGFRYPTPSNLNYFWNFGSLGLFFLIIQIFSGILLATHYTCSTDMAFSSLQHIMRDVEYGFFFRSMHANGASFFFFVIYFHMLKAIYYGSFLYPRQNLWQIGVLIYILMVATAFMGYVLPWGQMSFWGVTVITNLATALPLIDESFLIWFWGGYGIGDATIHRFFSLHYFLPFVLLFLVVLHFLSLHNWGSNNPLGINSKLDFFFFFPYFLIKDFFGLSFILFFYFMVVFFAPNYLGHPDNFVLANPLITPIHIVPEWYFLWFYAILRAVPSKTQGVLLVACSLIFLFFISFIGVFSKVRSATFKPFFQIFFFIFLYFVLMLFWIGSKPVEEPYVYLGQLSVFFYFNFFFILFFFSFFDQFFLKLELKKMFKNFNFFGLSLL